MIADRSATAGEKAVAGEAATRLRAKLNRQRAGAGDGTLQKSQGLMYALGKAWSRARGGEPAKAGTGVMYSLGRAWRKMTSKG